MAFRQERFALKPWLQPGEEILLSEVTDFSGRAGGTILILTSHAAHVVEASAVGRWRSVQRTPYSVIDAVLWGGPYQRWLKLQLNSEQESHSVTIFFNSRTKPQVLSTIMEHLKKVVRVTWEFGDNPSTSPHGLFLNGTSRFPSNASA